jgi:hypothetical protein
MQTSDRTYLPGLAEGLAGALPLAGRRDRALVTKRGQNTPLLPRGDTARPDRRALCHDRIKSIGYSGAYVAADYLTFVACLFAQPGSY